MNFIRKASEEDYRLLTEIGVRSFIESHGKSASQEDIDSYVGAKYSDLVMKAELADHKNVYHIIYHNNQAAGYSKIIFDSPYPDSDIKNITKLDRIYLLKEFYHLKLGSALFQLNMELSKEKGQKGMWLFVWKENVAAINFYTKKGFVIIGSHDFKISETHANPNHQMLLRF